MVSNVWTLLLVSAVRVQLSQPYRRIDTTRALYSFSFVLKLMLLLLQTLLCLTMADVAMPILVFISVEERPSLVSVEPRYLKASTFYNCCPFTWICAHVLFPLFTITLLFLLLTSIPYAPDLVVSLSVRSCSSWLLPPIKSILSAKRRLLIVLPPMETVELKSCSISRLMFSKKQVEKD